MITYETLKTYKDKCETALNQVADSLVATQESLEMLEKQQIAIEAQIETLDNLMDVEENPPIVELPFSGTENIEELFENRLVTHGDLAPEETYQNRQDVYRKEAMETVEALDAANRAESSPE